MVILLLALLCASQVDSYVLLQVRRDNQNRSNVDALIHKVVPADQFDQFAKKIAGKQFHSQRRQREELQKAEPTVAEFNSRSKEEGKQETQDVVNVVLVTKPSFRSQSLKIASEPEVVHFRSKPSLMYSLDSNMLVRAIQQLLSSSVVEQYADNMAQQAAKVYGKLRAASS